MRSRWQRALIALLVALLLAPPVYAQQGNDPVQQLIDSMPTRMRVGQLLLVSFPGVEVEDEAEIAALIRDYALGGVILSPRNGNFGETGVADPMALISMTNQLQQMAWIASQQLLSNPLEDGTLPSPSLYAPMFIAVESEVSGLPISTLIAGTTPQPTSLSFGATWSLPLTESAGEAVGRELSALGINLFLGPDLNVLQRPNPESAADLGVRSFGGDPFWVGELGRAYIRGLRQGSAGQMAIVPRHFPGLGSADRLLHEEIPTIQRPLGQLKLIELAPFYAVVADSENALATADGFLVTHIRYRGFQENLRAATRPISLDAAALQLALADVRPWRDAGGVLVADNLGLASVHRLYDPRGISFSGRRVVQDALTAGNDLLLLDMFTTTVDDWDAHFANIRDVLEYLVQRYENDPTFQEQVDAALFRLLRLKWRLYSGFALNQVLVNSESALPELGLGRGLTAQVATKALTRLVPFSDDLLPAVPQSGERIVVFTQERSVPVMDGVQIDMLLKNAVPDTILRLYGPEGTGQIRQGTVQAFSFADLATALAAETPLPPDSPAVPVLVALEQARWIVFATTGLDTRDPVSGALKDFLAQRSGLVSGQVIVLAFGTPYDLDSTEISKVDVCYALYSARPAFIETAVRAMFRDVVASGASPVNISAINYDLSIQTTPDPNQIITLSLVDEVGETLVADDIRKDDVIYLRTGPIVDRNGYPVPNGTPVQFILTYIQEGIEQRIAAETRAGMAMTPVTLDRVGQLDFTVLSEPASALFRLQLTIREDQSGEIVVIMPTPTPTPFAPQPTPVAPDLPTKEQVLPEPLYLPLPERSLLLVWGFVGLLACMLIGGLWEQRRASAPVQAVRVGLWCGFAASVGYTLLVILARHMGAGAFYRLASHEYLAGGVTLATGMLLLIGFTLVTSQRSRRQQDG